MKKSKKEENVTKKDNTEHDENDTSVSPEEALLQKKIAVTEKPSKEGWVELGEQIIATQSEIASSIAAELAYRNAIALCKDAKEKEGLQTRLAQILVLNGSFNEAQEVISDLRNKENSDPILDMIEGMLENSRENHIKAIELYKKAAESPLDNKDVIYDSLANTYKQMADTYKNEKKDDQAKNMMEQAYLAWKKGIALNPTNADYYYNLAQVCTILEKQDEVGEAVQKVIEFSSPFSSQWLNAQYIYAIYLMQRNKYEEVYPILCWLNLIMPDDKDFNGLLGETVLSLTKDKKMSEDLGEEILEYLSTKLKEEKDA